MIRFLFGRPGTGKTTRVVEEIKTLAAEEIRPVYLIVPEQQAYSAERDVLSVLPPSAGQCLSILSFSLIRVDLISKLFPYASAAAVGVSLTIIMDCVMTFFGSSANDACFNAWLTDSTDHTNRGAAEGINAMMPLVAILVVFGGFMGFNLDLASSWTIIFIIIIERTRSYTYNRLRYREIV